MPTRIKKSTLTKTKRAIAAKPKPWRARDVSKIKFLTQAEVRRLFSVIEDKRDRALFLLAYRHGLRASEVGLLQIDDIDLHRFTIRIQRLKGSLSGIHPLQPDEVKAIKATIKARAAVSYVDETYIKVKGRWTYLYRAIDREGNLVDVCLSETRDRAAAEAFFRSARTVTSSVPQRVTSHGHNTYPGAIKAELGEAVIHRTNRYLNTHLEQDHRGIKQRTRPMGGFQRVESARRFCRVHDEVRNFLRLRARRNEGVSLAQRRLLYMARTHILLTSLAAA